MHRRRGACHQAAPRARSVRTLPLHSARVSASLSSDHRSLLIAAGGGATAADLRRWGLTDGKIARLVRDGELHRVARGCFVLPTPNMDDVWSARRSSHLMELVARLPDGGVAGLRSAALLWRLPVAAMPEAPEIIRPPHAHRSRGVRTFCSSLTASHITEIRGVPVTTIERTCVDISLTFPVGRSSCDARCSTASGRPA
jgi:hypothetical protein